MIDLCARHSDCCFLHVCVIVNDWSYQCCWVILETTTWNFTVTCTYDYHFVSYYLNAWLWLANPFFLIHFIHSRLCILPCECDIQGWTVTGRCIREGCTAWDFLGWIVSVTLILSFYTCNCRSESNCCLLVMMWGEASKNCCRELNREGRGKVAWILTIKARVQCCLLCP